MAYSGYTFTYTCKYNTLTQLMYHFASYSSCSNWQPPTSMQTWHRRTRFWQLSLVCYEYWLHRPQVPYLKLFSGASPMESVKPVFKTHQHICQGVAESCTLMSCLHWSWWLSIWATVLIFIYISYFYLQIQYIDTINVSFCILQLLLKTATNLNGSMTSAYKILPHPDIFLVCLEYWFHGP